MRVLVTWGSKRGGTEGIARVLAETLQTRGFEVIACPAGGLGAITGFDAVIVGGALYANRWPRGLRRVVGRRVADLRKVPVWFFSSGPLDDSADRADLPPAPEVAVLAERVGAKAHVTFGGRLDAGAKGFPASAMAKTHCGDWRNHDRIRAWAARLADELPAATPGRPIDHPARSLTRLLGYAGAGWAMCAAVQAGFSLVASSTVATILQATAAPLLFTAVASRYFHARGARDPLSTAATWTAVVVSADLALRLAIVWPNSLDVWSSVTRPLLPAALIFLATWTTGSIASMMPFPRPASAA